MRGCHCPFCHAIPPAAAARNPCSLRSAARLHQSGHKQPRSDLSTTAPARGRTRLSWGWVRQGAGTREMTCRSGIIKKSGKGRKKAGKAVTVVSRKGIPVFDHNGRDDVKAGKAVTEGAV